MAPIKSIIYSGLSLLLSEVLGAKLLVTHFSGPLYTLDLTLTNATSGTLKITSQASGCGQVPTWLYLDQSTRTVYCFDESWYGSGVISQYSVDANGTLTLTGSAPTPGNSVHGSLYGGQDGKSFVVTSE
jgi:6-phosphogluconolactonase (cycloisomerase 2 family)